MTNAVRSIRYLVALLFLAAGQARADESYRLDIPEQPVTQALQSFAQQSGLQVVFHANIATGRTANRVTGTFSVDEALNLLLANTGLTFLTVNEHTIGIRAIDGASSTAGGSPTSQIGTSARDADGMSADNASSVHLAQADGSQTNLSAQTQPIPLENQSDQNSQNDFGQQKLEEIVVTAQKRSERSLDVPASITAISGDRLETLGVNSLADLADYVPGLTVSSSGAPGFRYVVIRGLNVPNAQAAPLVGTYVDDMPVGSTTADARGGLFGIDLNPYDVEDVEVLKGPQGTLYGSNAMAGLIKYKLRKPDLTSFDGSVGVDTAYIDGSGRVNEGIRGAVSVPLISNSLAVRVSGFFNDNAGYIDNVGTGIKDANHSTESGGRATLLWQVTDKLSLQATVLAQDVDAADLTTVTVNGSTYLPLNGSYSTSSLFPQPFVQQSRNYALTANWDLDFASFTSISSWSRVNSSLSEDFTIPFAQYTGYPGAIDLYEIATRASKFVEEMRLASPSNRRLQWMLGFYYTRENDDEDDNWPAFTSSYVPLPSQYNLLISTSNTTYKETAGFGNVTFKFTDRFDIGGGVRYSTYTQDNFQTSIGIFGAPSELAAPPSVGVASWMGNVRFHLDRDSMLYARVATGYRPGGYNEPGTIAGYAIPLSSQPDRTVTYEVGLKGEYFDRRLGIDGSIFHINWTNMQLVLTNSAQVGYLGNVGAASSSGFELTTNYQVMKGLRLDATLGFTNAHLTEDAVTAGGRTGEQLPLSARWVGSLTADYSRPLNERASLILGGGYRYRDSIINQFSETPGTWPANPAVPMSPQNIVDLYGGLTVRRATVKLYGRNVFNNHSYTGLQYIANPLEPKFVPIQPATIGLSVDYRF